MTACVLFGVVVPVFARSEPTRNIVGGAYPSGWPLASGGRIRNEDSCLVPVNWRACSVDAAVLTTPKAIPLWDNRLSSFCASLLRFLMAWLFPASACSRLLSLMLGHVLGAWEPYSAASPPEPPYRRQREHGALLLVWCAASPVYLIISHGWDLASHVLKFIASFL